MIKVFILQEVLAHFRIPFFNRLGQLVDLTICYSDPSLLKKRTLPNIDGKIYFNAKKVKSYQLLKGKLSFHPAVILALWKEKPDVVILEARLGFATALLTAILPKKNRHIAWWLSGYEPRERISIKKIKLFLWKKLYDRANAFICYGTSGRDYLKRFGITKNIFIAYNSLDSDELNFLKSKILSEDKWQEKREKLRKGIDVQLLYVGRIELSKNLHVLLQGIRYVKDFDKKYKFRLVCIGGGSEFANIKTMAQSIGIDELVEFTGPIYNQRELAEYFLSSDIFVLPGTGGLAINQAITYGLPVILSSADGTERDMVHEGENGFYFIQNDAIDLSNKINYLSMNNAVRNSMTEESLKIASEISNISNMLKGFIQAIEAVTDKKEQNSSN